MRFIQFITLVAFFLVMSIFASAQEKAINTLQVNGNKIELKNNLLLLPEIRTGLTMPIGKDIGLFPEKIELVKTNRNLQLFNFEGSVMNLIPPGSAFLTLPLYPGLANFQNFGGTLGTVNLNSKLAMEYGAFVSTQYGYLNSSKEILLGSNVLFRYKLSDNLDYLIWGQYVTPNKNSDPVFNIPTFFPKTNIGSGLQYNSTDKAKIRVGIEYKYDQSDKTWKPESGGKVLFNF